MNKHLINQIGPNARLKNSLPRGTVKYGLTKRQRIVHHLQGIIIDLKLVNACSAPCHIDAKPLNIKQSTPLQQVDITCQCHCISRIL